MFEWKAIIIAVSGGFIAFLYEKEHVLIGKAINSVITRDFIASKQKKGYDGEKKQ